MLKKMLASEYNKNILKVFSGSLIGQAISIIAVPIIALFYSKEDLGLYQIFLSTITTFSVIGALRYELAIVLPEDKDVCAISFTLLLNTNYIIE